MKIHIREADRDNSCEIDLIIGRCMESYLETIPEFNGCPRLAREVWPEFTYDSTKEKILSPIRHPNQKILVAVDEYGELLGHSVFFIETTREQGTYGSFLNHYLAPEHRRFGIGSILLSTAEELMQSAGALSSRAQAHVKNFKAQNLFKKSGYQLIGPKLSRWPYYELKKSLDK